MSKGTKLADGFCQGCGEPREVIMVEYDGMHPDHYDGVSEYRCLTCDRREGRWSGRVLQEGDTEPRYGGRHGRT